MTDQPTLLIDPDDLFATPPPDRGAPLTARITCRACPTPRLVEVPILRAAKLCDECYRDLQATAAHIADVERLSQARRNEAGERYEAEWSHADDTTRDQLDRILAQRESLEFDARLAKARRLPDWASALALWELRQSFDQAALDCDRIEGWARAAMDEVREARS